MRKYTSGYIQRAHVLGEDNCTHIIDTLSHLLCVRDKLSNQWIHLEYFLV